MREYVGTVSVYHKAFRLLEKVCSNVLPANVTYSFANANDTEHKKVDDVSNICWFLLAVLTAER